MDKENENLDVVEETLPEEETTQDEVTETEEETSEENEVTLSKEEFTKLKRKAIAYDANKSKPKVETTTKAESTNQDYLEDVFMVKDLSEDEYKTLKGEAKDLGIDFKKYLTSQSGKTVLDKLRGEKKSKDSMEKLSSKSPVYKKFTQEDLSKMSSKEMEKILTDN